MRQDADSISTLHYHLLIALSHIRASFQTAIKLLTRARFVYFRDDDTIFRYSGSELLLPHCQSRDWGFSIHYFSFIFMLFAASPPCLGYLLSAAWRALGILGPPLVYSRSRQTAAAAQHLCAYEATIWWFMRRHFTPPPPAILFVKMPFLRTSAYFIALIASELMMLILAIFADFDISYYYI